MKALLRRFRSFAQSAAWLPWAIVLIGCTLSVAAAVKLRADAEADTQRRFELASERIEAEVVRRLRLPLYGLSGVRGVYVSSAEVSRDEFAAYAASRELTREFPGVRGFGFIEHVPRQRLDAFVAAARADGAPGFEVRQLDEREHPDLWVIKYIEPRANNAEAVGLDVGSEANRRTAIERAVDTGQPTLTAPVTLLQDGRRLPGFLLFLPVYRRGAETATPLQRRQALIGVAYTPFVAAELFDGALDAASGLAHFRLLHGLDASARDRVVYDAAWHAGAPRGIDGARRAGHRFEDVRRLDVFGSDFTLRLNSAPALDASLDSRTPALALAAGLLLTAFLAYLARNAAVARERAEALARRLTADLSRLAAVARYTSNAVVITDLTRRITWVNEGFTRVTGYSLDEAVGRSPGEMLQTPHTDAAEVARLRAALDAAQPFRGELLNRAKDGREYWIELEIQPVYDAEGRHSGFMAIESDITQRRLADAALARATRENEALLGTIRAHAIVSVAAPDGTIIDVNDAFCAISGYGRDELLGHSHRIINSGHHPRAFWEHMWRTVQAGQPWRGLVCNRRKDGSLYWVDSIVAPFAGPDGRIEKYVSLRTDVTATKRAAQEIESQRRRLQQIVEGTGAGTWEHDFVTGDDRINELYASMLGYDVATLTELMQRSFLELVHPDDRNLARQATLDHLEQRTPEYSCEFRMRHRDGRWVWFLSRGRVSARDEQGRARSIAGIQLDITPRKQAEAALQAVTERLRLAVDSAGIGVWDLDLVGDALTWDAGMHRLYASDPAGAADPLATFNARMHPSDAARVEAARAEALAGGQAYDLEFRIVWPDGQVRHLRAAASVVRDPAGGRPLRMIGVNFDVTDQRRSEQAARQSQAFLDRAGRISGVGGWALDLATRSVYWSDQTCRIHDRPPGYRPGLDEALAYYAPEAQLTISTAVQTAMQTGDGWDLELPLVTATGRRIWVRAMGEAELVDGQPVRLVGALQDVTMRRVLEAELRRKNELMQSILDNLPCGLAVYDEDLRLLAHNAEMPRLLQLPPQLMQREGLTLGDVWRCLIDRGELGPGDRGAMLQAVLDRAREAMRGPHRYERTRPDGIVIEARGGPMQGGGFVATYTDVTDRKRAEDEVRRSDALLRGAIDAVDEAFVLFDPADRLVLCNDKYRDLYRASADLIVEGASFEQIVRGGAERGQYPQAVGRIDDWVAERVAAHRSGNVALLQTLDDGRVVRVIERRMPDGHIVGFRIDVTDLMRATEAAQQASQAKSRFLANMSHEIRTPMNAILGMLTLLRRSQLTPRQADYAAKAERAARSLLGLLNDILDFSKVEAGKMQLDPQPLHVDQLMRDLSVILSANAAGKPVEVLFDLDPALPPVVVADALRLQQVLINLGGNAIKFTPVGEVVVGLRVVERRDDEVTLDVEVRDTGIGIAPDHQQRIFSGFTQAEASTTRRFGGTGLGLAISQRLVAMMGGELGLHSTPGVGSRFFFRLTLPLPAATATTRGAAADAIGAQAASGAALRALVVDDNAAAREVISRMASSLGWSVDSAPNGEQALARLAAAPGRYDAVFTDWQMPGLDGWQTCQLIRQRELGGNVPLLVMVTANGRDLLAQRSEADRGLIDGFLVKPLTPSMLRDAIADARAARQPAQARTAPGAVASRGPARLAGLRLLLVEDNPNNQQVARELLEDEGAQVSVAGNGAEGVHAVATTQPPFDAVLMDLQMPVMDGYAAAHAIRDDLRLQTLPIVAMTANAMEADREACLAAGMNEHVGKPFDLDQLVDVLCRLTGRGPARTAVPPPQRPSLSPSLIAAAREAGVEIQPALDRLGGAVPVYARLLGNLAAELGPGVERIAAHAAAGERGEARRALHTLKGLAATLGLSALARAAADAEHAATAPAVDGHDELAGACERLRRALPDLQPLREALAWHADAATPVGGVPAPRGDHGDDHGDEHDRGDGARPAAASAELRTLSRLLADADMEALAAMERLRRTRHRLDPARLQALDDAVGRLDFDDALRLCQDLLLEQPA